MATLLELTNLVSTIIDDKSLDADIPEYLNQGINEIAAGMSSTLGSFATPPLPELFTIETKDTSTSAAFVAMPTTFQRNLQFVADSSGREIDIYDSMIEFAQDYPLMDKTGRVDAVVEQGGNLYYQRIPDEAETLTLHFYRLPVEMSDNTDTPDGIPLTLQRPLLVNYAAWKLYELIEDPTAGEGANVARYMSLFSQALQTLERRIPADARSFSTLSIGMEV